MARGQKVRIDQLKVGDTFLLSHGFGNNVVVTYTREAMGKVWIIPAPWKKVYVFEEADGVLHELESQQVVQSVYHMVDAQ